MYLKNPRNPVLPPACQIRVRMISGCIEREGGIYRQVPDCPHHNAQKLHVMPSALSTHGEMLGLTPKIQLVV